MLIKLMVRLFSFIVIFAISFNYSPGQTKNSFNNPILEGFYPDPSICRVGNDFYLVNSTFSYYPGITVFHSTDLVHWKLIGYVLDRPEQLNLDGQGVSRGIFAPAIWYRNGTFYVTCTLVDIGGNFVATAKDPAGPWSNPKWLPQVNGIDPSLFFDDDGKAYIIYNSIPPDNKSLYSGHRTLRMFGFDPDNLKVIGEEKLLVNGGTDISKQPVWIEGPHIFKKDGVYYLIAAEGGTAEQHSEVVFKSTKVDGPYVSYPNNPILTQRQLDPKRKFPITCTGHADFVQTLSGDWWAVFLGCRPYPPAEENYYNNGRETFLAPVTWVGGWPVINRGHDEVQYSYPSPILLSKDLPEISYSGNFKTRDDFDAPDLNINWQFLRTPHERWYNLGLRKGFLAMKLKPETCAGNMNPGFLGRRQQHTKSSASTAIDFDPGTEHEKAGLAVFQNEKHFYFLCKSIDSTGPVVQLYRSADRADSKNEMELIASQSVEKTNGGKELYLKIESKGNTYSFFFSEDIGVWTLLKENVDARYLSTRVAGGFVGCMYALYGTSLGEHGGNWAYYDWFEYEGNDDVYR